MNEQERTVMFLRGLIDDEPQWVHEALAKGASPTLPIGFDLGNKESWRPPISYACAEAGLEIFEALLDKGAEINVIHSETGDNLLHLVVADTHYPYECYLNGETWDGRLEKLLKDKVAMAKILLKKGVSPYHKNKRGKTPFDFADKFDEIIAVMKQYKPEIKIAKC